MKELYGALQFPVGYGHTGCIGMTGQFNYPSGLTGPYPYNHIINQVLTRCAYCGTRWPNAIGNCNNCGATL